MTTLPRLSSADTSRNGGCRLSYPVTVPQAYPFGQLLTRCAAVLLVGADGGMCPGVIFRAILYQPPAPKDAIALDGGGLGLAARRRRC